MSKAEEAAYKTYPYNGDYRGQGDSNSKIREAYINGYHQAERDLKLTWEDVREICTQSVLVEIDLGGLVSDERHYTEVLKRFKAQKGEEV